MDYANLSSCGEEFNCLIDCYLEFLSLAAGPDLTKWVVFYCTEKKNPRYSTRAAMSCMTLSYLLFQYCLIFISWSLRFNSTLLSHMLFLLCGVLFTWITLAHHWGLSLCAPYSERHSLTKFLLCFSFPIVLFLFLIIFLWLPFYLY